MNSLLVARYSLLKTVHKRILIELFQSFALSLVALNSILMMEKVLRLSRFLSGVGASVPDMIRIILYLQPQVMMLTIPMSFLLATLLTYGRLNTDNELIILKTAGMSFKGISVPVFIIGVICFLTGIAVSFSLGPLGAAKVRETLSRIVTQKAPLAIEAGIFNTSFRDITILVRDKPSPEQMQGIFIYDNRNSKEPKVMTAREGRVYFDREYSLSLYLKDGLIHIARPGGSTEIFFSRYNLSLGLAAEGPARKSSELTPRGLLREAEGKEQRQRMSLLLEFHRRLSLPSLCLLLMLLGPPLSLLAGKSGRLGGLTIGMGVFTLFYIMLVYGENTARAGTIPHYVGAWAPAAIVGIASLLAFKKAGSR